MVDTYSALPASARTALAAIAEHLEPSSDQIADVMVEGYVAEIPEYAEISDSGLLADVQSVSAALVRCWFRMLRTGDPVDPEMMRLIQEGARRRAAQGMDLSALLRAYRLGVRSMWTQLIATPEWTASARLRRSTALITTWVLDYSDLLCTQVESCFMDEASKAARHQEYRRSALLNVILASSVPESAERLGDLQSPHLVVVVDTGAGRSMSQLEELGQGLERFTAAVLWTVRHDSVVAVVPTSTQQRDVVRSRLSVLSAGESMRVGLGGIAHNPRDTRESYLEATDALRVGPLVGPGPSRVYDYLDLAPVVEMLRHPERAARFAAAVLEPFAAMSTRSWALPTLEAHLVHRGRHRDVAEALDIHINTLKYRLNELRSSSGGALDAPDQAESVLLAVRLRRALAPANETDTNKKYHR